MEDEGACCPFSDNTYSLVVVLTKFGHRKCFAAFFLYKYSRADFYQSDRCSVVLFVDDGL